MTPRRILLAIVSAASLLAPLAFPAFASAQSIGDEVASHESRLAQLRQMYVRPVGLSRELNYTARLAEGQVRYNFGEFEEASIILGELVDSQSFRTSPGYRDAVWMLADSLYNTRQFILAKVYFTEIVERNDPVYGLDAARRLLEIAFELNDFDGLDDLYNELQAQGGRRGPEIDYVRGKALYYQGNYGGAYNAFASIPMDAEVYQQAVYFGAVCDVREGNYDRALTSFETLISTLEATEGIDDELSDVAALRDLSQLAVGRIYYEQELWDQAAFAYQRVPRTSPRFDVALYETSWTRIREEDYSGAIDSLEILELVAMDRRFIPESKLLRGDLWMRLGDYERAMRQFTDVADEYTPVEIEIRELTERHEDPSAFFDSLVDAEEGALRLPTLARPWFENDPMVDRALALIVDLEVLQQAVDESREIISQIDAALSGDAGVRVFPILEEGWGEGAVLENAVIDTKIDVVELQRAAAAGALTGSTAAQYEALYQTRVALQERFEGQPRTFSEMASRSQGFVDSLSGVSLEAFRAEQEISQLQGDIDALREFVAEQRRAGTRSPEAARQLEAELDRVEAELDEWERLSERLRDDIEIEQAAAGIGDAANVSERELKSRLIAALNAEANFLAGLPGGDVDGAMSYHQRLDAISTGLDAYFGDLSELVASGTADFREVLDQERAALERYQSVLDAYRGDGEDVAGNIAFDAYVGVQERFSELTLRANLGVLDVSWRQKEEITERIGDLFDERNQQINILDADFAEILGED